MFDNPELLLDMVNQSGAQSTQRIDSESVEQLYAKCKPIADSGEPIADSLWEAYQEK